MNRIHQLSPELASQIAAGEVIERPASVVKELLENAVDSGADDITVIIEAGGVQRIEVRDNGRGIHPDDLVLAIQSHATSKIKTLNDLFSIQSLGFRGEALGSIASVSKLSIVSHLQGERQGYGIAWDMDTQSPRVTPQASKPGTIVCVRDLFYNVPVRRKFLNTEQTEWLQVVQMVKRMVISHPEISFQLQGKTTLSFPKALNLIQMQQRVSKVFGKAFLDKSEYIDVNYEGIRLWGWVANASFMRSQNDLQYSYLNGRMIRDKVVLHAIRTAYAPHLYPGRQPAFLLYLEMDPAFVDVNVHPTKHEVRFQEPRMIHDFLVSTIARALSNATQILEELESKKYTTETEPEVLSISDNIAEYHIASTNLNMADEVPVLNLLHAPYYLLKYNAASPQLLLCHAQQLYEGFCGYYLEQALQNKEIVSRPLLIPLKLTLPNAAMEQKMYAAQNELESLGFELNPIDENRWLVRAFPALLPYLDFDKWIALWNSNEDLITSLLKANTPQWMHSYDVLSLDLQAFWKDFLENFKRNTLDKWPACVREGYRKLEVTDWSLFLKGRGE